MLKMLKIKKRGGGVENTKVSEKSRAFLGILWGVFFVAFGTTSGISRIARLTRTISQLPLSFLHHRMVFLLFLGSAAGA